VSKSNQNRNILKNFSNGQNVAGCLSIIRF